MGMRFRKSINLGGGARINLSKKGIGYSVGGKGFRVAKKAGGGTRTTASIAGTGISYTKDSSGKSKKAAQSGSRSAAGASKPQTNKPYTLLHILFMFFAIVLIGVGALVAIVDWKTGLPAIAFGILLFLIARNYKKKAAAQKRAAQRRARNERTTET